MDEQQERPRRGELRIYLGAAPGVGKTFAMLGEAWRRKERGTDVVVGLVETHGRKKTAQLLDGMEVVPRRRGVYRGSEFTEMDVEAVLARAPEVAIVDELAHTNIPGSRHEKRWQDVEELLEAGIDVLSTVNVQHLQSLNDVVEKITGVPQQETVPDEVVRKAEQVELVDITPEALRRRLAHGNVYPAERIDAALSNYFRPGNLTALRELALLWVADQVDVALQRYRAQQRITDTWETRERVVVSVTGGPESETLIQRGSRIAARAGAELLVVHVLRGDGLTGVGPAEMGRFRKLAEDLGATFHTVVGDDVPTALLDFARGVNATQLVLGTSRRSRLARLFDQGIGATVVQRSGAIDVHMVTHEEAGGRLRKLVNRSPIAASRRVSGWVLALLLPAVATAIGALLRRELDFSTDVVDYFLATVLVALVGGLGPALLAAFLSAGLLNFFFTEPFYTLTVHAQSNVITLVAMVVVGVLVALVVDTAARQGKLAAQARTEASLLASYAKTVLTNTAPLPRLLEKVRENFGLEAVSLVEKRDGVWHRVEECGPNPCGEPDEADVDVPVTADVHLTLRGRALPAADRRVLEAAAGQALLALRQQRLAAATARAERKAEATELRTALLSALGHDLRTPLTSIKASIGSLRAQDIELSPEDTEELLATAEESTDRLAGLVDNLLDSSRLATGAVRPQLRPVGYDDVVAHALSTVDNSESVVVSVDARLPAVLADPGLLERVVANVIDNALRHGRGPEPVQVRASTHAEYVELRVIDHGRGLKKGASDSAFAPFQRLGDRDNTPGIGLGLSVAKGFTEAMGGTIRAEDTPGGGLTVVVSLPAAREGQR
ncbi:two-component system, OmpR family, sensor histidine kinase KdpD [Amycolatopsis sacchari]|uniref:histidine kinase n=1 Tax=Amycolatopsis sacchari TaxID=115433 RepID=A0A1I4D6E9_9PSEU|nr:sensor histidine kinase KdpD [Amycolatopsis sacchari]SFK88573.1 two-component system, OmpR family, sensor histidine kinase KdpD [Amycolatopsis sacchari]